MVVAALVACLVIAGQLSANQALAVGRSGAGDFVADRTFADPTLTRPAGLAVDGSQNGRVYTLDTARPGVHLSSVGPDGGTVARWSLPGATARNVTDLSRGAGGELWVGDLGDTRRRRGQVALYALRTPSTRTSNLSAVRYRMRYADGRHDARALLVNPATGRVYVVTRSSRAGEIYEAPRRLSRSRVNVLHRIGPAPAGVSGGEFSGSGKLLALAHGRTVSVYAGFGHLSRTLLLPPGTVASCVSFTRDGGSVLVGSPQAHTVVLRAPLAIAPQVPAPVASPVSGPPAATGPSAPTDGPVAPPVPVTSLPAPAAGFSLTDLGWRGVQAPRPESVMLVDPADGPDQSQLNRPGVTLRVELRDGESVNTGGYVAPRAEVYGRNPIGTWSGTPASRWPDPPGSTRWYDFSVYVPGDFPLASDSRWLDFTQWKGYRGGSPPIALEMHRYEFRLGGSNIARSLGNVARGGWTRFTVGLHFSTSSLDGWVQVYRNGALALAKTSVATMDVVNGDPDPIYLKQGIYRSWAWHDTQVLWFSPMNVTEQDPLA